jgi:Tfp pilus assembly protein PilO
MTKEQNNNSWHLSKSVPVSLIVALVLQASAIVWTVSQMQSSISQNATNIIRLETRTEKIEMAVQSQAIALARIDENIKAIRESVEQIARQEK